MRGSLLGRLLTSSTWAALNCTLVGRDEPDVVRLPDGEDDRVPPGRSCRPASAIARLGQVGAVVGEQDRAGPAGRSCTVLTAGSPSPGAARCAGGPRPAAAGEYQAGLARRP